MSQVDVQPLVLGKVKVTAGRLPGGRGEGKNAIHMVDAVSGTVARFVPEDGRARPYLGGGAYRPDADLGYIGIGKPRPRARRLGDGRQLVDRFH